MVDGGWQHLGLGVKCKVDEIRRPCCVSVTILLTLTLCFYPLPLHAPDFKTGLTIAIEGQPNKIVEFQHVKQARGAASTKTKCKNMITGATLERTIQAKER